MAKASRPASSNKRIPVEADSAERMPIATTSAFQRSVSTEATTKTFRDLPTELMEDILVKAVVAEVRDRNETKCTWKQVAGRVISRLSKVSARWSEILTTKRFQLELQKHLDTPPLHLEVVAKLQIDSAVAVTTMNNEIYVLCHDETTSMYVGAFVNVYDRNDLSKVKQVFHIGAFHVRKPTGIAACGRMNCLFVIGDYGNGIYVVQSQYDYVSVLWKYLYIPATPSALSVSAEETLVVTASGLPSFIQECKISSKRSLRRVRMREDILSMGKAIRKSNGNFVFESLQSDHVRRLREIDADGNIVQQRRLPLCDVPSYDVDMDDRIMIAGPHNMVRILGEQFQEIQVFAPGDVWNHPSGLHYDQKANEWMLIDDGKYLTVLSIKEGKATHDDNTDFA